VNKFEPSINSKKKTLKYAANTEYLKYVMQPTYFIEVCSSDFRVVIVLVAGGQCVYDSQNSSVDMACYPFLLAAGLFVSLPVPTII
jgi:hypothetical protein